MIDSETESEINANELFRDLFDQYVISRREGLEGQLKEVRNQKHNLYQGLKEERKHNNITTEIKTNIKYNEIEISNSNEIWPTNTILILDDSMINQLDQDRLSVSTNKIVKVMAFGGADINNIYTKIEDLLKKRPKTIILHVGTNDAINNQSKTILEDLLKLKQYIESNGISVILSCPITRTDNGKARLTILHVIEKMKLLKEKCLLNTNIRENLLGRKG